MAHPLSTLISILELLKSSTYCPRYCSVGLREGWQDGDAGRAFVPRKRGINTTEAKQQGPGVRARGRGMSLYWGGIPPLRIGQGARRAPATATRTTPAPSRPDAHAANIKICGVKKPAGSGSGTYFTSPVHTTTPQQERSRLEGWWCGVAVQR